MGDTGTTRGALETTPSRSQYFAWINNTNEGSTGDRTLAGLEFFRWLHDESGNLDTGEIPASP